MCLCCRLPLTIGRSYFPRKLRDSTIKMMFIFINADAKWCINKTIGIAPVGSECIANTLCYGDWSAYMADVDRGKSHAQLHRDGSLVHSRSESFCGKR
jgi:hypothetical protein